MPAARPGLADIPGDMSLAQVTAGARTTNESETTVTGAPARLVIARRQADIMEAKEKTPAASWLQAREAVSGDF